MDRCPGLHILSVLFWKRPKHMLKHRRTHIYTSHLVSSQSETQVIIGTTGLILYPVNQPTFMQLRKGKLSRIRSQPSGTARSAPGPARPQVQPAPPPLVQRSWDTRSSPATLPKAKNTGGRGFSALPDDFLPPPPPLPPLDDPELPPPLDFVLPPPAVAKRPPMPHPRKRHEESMFRSSK
ncbi:amyloid beta A4 precursor protein-binding family B member 1-interacting protein-like isoform X2 [Pongo pygmaeus]|uniref:amyloid beta A4 precursor protein-binding family B member 1-interacting protein-like isoform X2 n=1 Tax=Pongo pygmaeus TaxID=9600 RepID=UPI0023E147DD|nr:amyloid beta A4 precursor protein-binding family B member 1-interacting protein-like isoform X2 [Pongo pygmaeus]XP_054292588.1 amyloid beta A4 precursor protein-binding family B member 1-interacting protein-like isoform X2 [Pongo pygmaeus]XP_054292591.1 amyloid beta A4 precursor protein-binding family B member 1-interacting protein-like isoform X2 [Pongo pygmaeus]XP_054379148.1 amyloid beta A4 precursor protein-binding family B member 1-interacting protein-like isoform X1 [Pongo abelii]